MAFEAERIAGCVIRAGAGDRLGHRVPAVCLVMLAGVLLGACQSSPPARSQPKTGAGTEAAHSATAGSPTPTASAPTGTATAAGSGSGTSAAAPSTNGAVATGSPPVATPRPEVPDTARMDFERAVRLMRDGDAAEAELGFKQIALEYPQFAAPLVNLAILQRKAGQLSQAEDTLKSAISHESGSAVAWTELGATQRMRGEFTDAAASYEQAIAADPRYAPAWRNLGVLEDLYLEDPSRALKAFEQYKQLTAEEEPVNGWIAELRQRLGLAPVKRPAASDSSAPKAPGEEPSQPGGAPQDTQPQSGEQQGGDQGGEQKGGEQPNKPSEAAPLEVTPTQSPDAQPGAPGPAAPPEPGPRASA